MHRRGDQRPLRQRGLWARYHTGLDFRASYGTPIRAVKAGVVVYAGNKGNWAGNHVAVRHADQMTTMSSHMSSMAVRSGQAVQAGQVIGYVGQTGRAFGAHLHFELYPAAAAPGDVYRAVDPVPWLHANGVSHLLIARLRLLVAVRTATRWAVRVLRREPGGNYRVYAGPASATVARRRLRTMIRPV